MFQNGRAHFSISTLAAAAVFSFSFNTLAQTSEIQIPVQILEGYLATSSEGNLVFQNQTLSNQQVFYPKSMASSMRSLLETHRPIRMETYWDPQTKEIEVLKTPTLIGALTEIRGVFSKNDGERSYSIGDQKIQIIRHEPIFSEGKVITNGTQIDDLTLRSWIGKSVIARGEMKDGILQAVAIVPSGMLTAQDPASTDKSSLYSRQISQGTQTVHRSVFKTADAKTALPGESVFMLTLSGRQGDDVDAVGGHFAAGVGTIQKDLTIEGEFFNVYVQNEKDIVPGNTDWVNYFGHFIEGQSNYRPTYTLVMYGLSPERVQKIRDLLDMYHPAFRTGKIPLSINFNCTTLTVQAMAAAGIYGKQRNERNDSVLFPVLSSEKRVLKRPITDIHGKLNFALQSKDSEFLPRPAFDNIVANIEYLNKTENLGIERVDLIFNPQNISKKARGGAPLASFAQALKLQLLKSLGGYSDAQALSDLD